MKKLLIYFSYIGTRYQGLQRLIKVAEGADKKSIQGILDSALTSVFRQRIIAAVSSRTDSGVHALLSTAHCFVNEDVYNKTFSPEKFCLELNNILEDNSEDIRVRRIVEVPLDFHCRSWASSRTYVYRVGVFKDYFGIRQNTLKIGGLPIKELYRCHPISQPFDADIVKATCSLFLGTWNFRSFMMSSRETRGEDYDEHCVKTLNKISFSKVHNYSALGVFDSLEKDLDFYEFHIESSGFVRRQVRRMVGTLISVGKGILKPSDILFMLKNPKTENWAATTETGTSDGLYLKSVNYSSVPVVRGLYS